jgi:ketosteroid isomerase-like protein
MPDESTTPDLVELQRRLTAATNRGDADAVVAFYASDAVYDMSPVGMGVFEGQAAAPDFRMELDGVEEVDSKRVIAFLRNNSTGRASGIRMAWPQTNVYDLVDGKISHIRIFVDRQEALKAVGLEE